ncbi:MAG: hypothetical protein ACR2RV_20415 [Verrucomicrobiales bacterium]
MRTCLVNLMVAVAVGQLVIGGRCVNAQEKEGVDTPAPAPAPAPAAPNPVQESKPSAAKIPGQAVAEQLEKLYDDLLLDYVDGRGATVDELIQVHRMAVEARELGGRQYRKSSAVWWGAATERASQLARLLEQRFKAGDLSQTKVRIARANLELTKAKHAAAEAREQAAVRAAIAQQAAQKAAQSQNRARSRRVSLPPPPKK